MSKALSMDLRDRVLGAVDGGAPCREAAARFGVSAANAQSDGVSGRRRRAMRGPARWVATADHSTWRACGPDPEPAGGPAGRHPGRVSGGPGRTGRDVQFLRPVALLPASSDHTQKSRLMRTNRAAPTS